MRQMLQATGHNENEVQWWYSNDIYEYNKIYMLNDTKDTHHDTEI